MQWEWELGYWDQIGSRQSRLGSCQLRMISRQKLTVSPGEVYWCCDTGCRRNRVIIKVKQVDLFWFLSGLLDRFRGRLGRDLGSTTTVRCRCRASRRLIIKVVCACVFVILCRIVAVVESTSTRASVI